MLGSLRPICNSRSKKIRTHVEAQVTFYNEFAIDTSTSFSDAERQSFTDLRGKFLNLLGLRIEILLAKMGILLFESDY